MFREICTLRLRLYVDETVQEHNLSEYLSNRTYLKLPMKCSNLSLWGYKNRRNILEEEEKKAETEVDNLIKLFMLCRIVSIDNDERGEKEEEP